MRYPTYARSCLCHLLTQLQVDTTLDVGANAGQYAMELRSAGFEGRIISFEPDPKAFQSLQRNAAADDNWICHNFALGDQESDAVLNIALRSGFNSFLQANTYLRELDSGSHTVATENVRVRRLDQFWREEGLDGHVVFLKIDTQGYEKQVLLGASQRLGEIVAVQLEMSLRRIYAHQPQIEETIPFMTQKGFGLYGVWDGFRDRRTGQLLEIDALFVNTKLLL